MTTAVHPYHLDPRQQQQNEGGGSSSSPLRTYTSWLEQRERDNDQDDDDNDENDHIRRDSIDTFASQQQVDDYSESDDGASNYFLRQSVIGTRLLSFALSSTSTFFTKLSSRNMDLDTILLERPKEDMEQDPSSSRSDDEDDDILLSWDDDLTAETDAMTRGMSQDSRVDYNEGRQQQQLLDLHRKQNRVGDPTCCFKFPLQTCFGSFVNKIKEESRRQYCSICGKVIITNSDGYAPLARDTPTCSCYGKKLPI